MIGPINGLGYRPYAPRGPAGGTRPAGAGQAADQAAATESAKALVPVARSQNTRTDYRHRPIHAKAAYLAHLIANRDHHPQTRQRRRAADDVASEAYRANQRLTLPIDTGLTLRRTA